MRTISYFLFLVFVISSCNQSAPNRHEEQDASAANEPVFASSNDSLRIYMNMIRGVWYVSQEAQPVMEIGNNEITHMGLVKSRYNFIDLHTIVEQDYEGNIDTLLIHFINDTLVLQSTKEFKEKRYVRTP